MNSFLQRMGLCLRNAEVLSYQDVVVPNVGNSAGEHDASGVEQHDIVGETEGQIYILLDQQDRLAILLEPRNGAAELGDDDRRKPFRWLVHQQHARIAYQRAGDGEHLLLAA